MSGIAGLGLLAKLAGAKLAKVPPKVWYALAIISALAVAYFWHQHAAHKALKAADSAGYARAMNDVETRAKALKAKADALSAKISAEERKRNDETNRRISAAADDLRLRGPGKAVCPRSPGVPIAARGRVAANGIGDAAGPQVPSDDLAAVPWGWLVKRSEEHDLDRAEVLSWRDWYEKQKAAWPH